MSDSSWVGRKYRDIPVEPVPTGRKNQQGSYYIVRNLQYNLGGIVNIQLHFHLCDAAFSGPLKAWKKQ